jgi:TolB-like protein/Tfp pilus assembly protein PilF
MTEASRAVFLSYASQDAEAARHLCEALRAAGVEVWFDQSELRGGDAWDAMIRRQVKECALFVPVISSSTEARREGYFRREWNLAVARTLDMSEDETFLLPVVIDDILDASARVPEKFRSVQWTHMPGGLGAETFAQRVRQLLGDATEKAIPAIPRAAMRNMPAKQSEPPSIAVLPFVNLSRDEENEYFADGLAEELLNVLAKIRGLRVAARTSSFSFKGKDADVPTIAGKLNVATVLEGSVRKAGSRVRVTAQLVNARNGYHLWSETYDRQLDDIFAVQDDIAQSVVQELRSALLGESATNASAASAVAEVKHAVSGRSENAQAFQLYLQARFFAERVNQQDTDKAVALLQEAVDIDPGFALAWAELSRIQQQQAGYGFAEIREGMEQARQSAFEALRIAPDLPEGYVALGLLQQGHDWDWNAAEASLRRALDLMPGKADALRALASLARYRGKLDEALALVRQAIALDPLSVRMYTTAGIICLNLDRLDDAAGYLAHALAMNPSAGLSHAMLAGVRCFQGRTDEALADAEAESHPVFRRFVLAIVQHARGNREQSDAQLQELIEGFGWTASYQIAMVHAARGEVDQAFTWLDRAYEQRDPGLAQVMCDRYFRSLYDDPRWPRLLKKMRFID